MTLRPCAKLTAGDVRLPANRGEAGDFLRLRGTFGERLANPYTTGHSCSSTSTVEYDGPPSDSPKLSVWGQSDLNRQSLSERPWADFLQLTPRTE